MSLSANLPFMLMEKRAGHRLPRKRFSAQLIRAIANRSRDVEHRIDTIRAATRDNSPLTRRRCSYGTEIRRLPRPPKRCEMHRGAFGRFRGGTDGGRDPARENGAQVPDHSRVQGHDPEGDEGGKPARLTPPGRGNRAHRNSRPAPGEKTGAAVENPQPLSRPAAASLSAGSSSGLRPRSRNHR